MLVNAASSAKIIALLHGPDQPGLVAGVAGWIHQRGGNILHADQHRDPECGVFFQRVEWSASVVDASSEATAFREMAHGFGMEVTIALRSHRPRVAVFCSKQPHAAEELLSNWQQGDLPCEIVALVSNHPDLSYLAERHRLPFHCVPVEQGRKAEAEANQLELLRGLGVELVILARYMQVLSADFLDRVGCPVINIHHSFLPAFAGARPYHQAHARGVKLIGATAHYVTAVLDDGPIIHQDVRRVSHREAVADLLRKGRDVEKLVLSEAVRLHLERRVLVYGHKTVVFD